MPETWVHRYCYRDKSGQVVVVSKTVKRQIAERIPRGGADCKRNEERRRGE